MRNTGPRGDAEAIGTLPSFGALLRRHRLQAGFTQEALAEHAGLGVRTLQALERSEGLPQAATARHLIEALGLTGEARTHFEEASKPAPRASRPVQRTHSPRTVHNGTPTNLPVPWTSFVGREAELRRIPQLLAGTRLLTLTGPPGVGKTRLAQQVAASLLSQFAGGVFFVPLAPVTDPELVLPTIARTLDVQESAERSLPEVLKNALASRSLLLVLDNLEQVLPAAPLVADLLAICPQLKVLATSRAVLHLSGEQEFPVPPLTLPDRQVVWSPQNAHSDAVVLFAERAREARPDFALTPENAPTILEICHRLDGLPLAIELAAARIRVLTLPALLDRLERRLPLLTGG
ncbi:MAG TPA: helix-turn-helix domain-containing protein, partial [Chloroflexota bacterium]|nr:helix-turn-helix domain-containing protein [Chloroflexota bacterium]